MQSEIRTDCEVCFDSERVRSREMGVYSKGKLKSRFCSNAEVRGVNFTLYLASLHALIKFDFSGSPLVIHYLNM